MEEESISGSIHMHYIKFFLKSLFHKYAPNNEDDRMHMSDTYAF